MRSNETLSDTDRLMRVDWLEREIDMCLSYDLPTAHLVEELIILNGEPTQAPALTVYVK